MKIPISRNAGFIAGHIPLSLRTQISVYSVKHGLKIKSILREALTEYLTKRQGM